MQAQLARGLSLYQAGDYDQAVAVWSALRARLPAERAFKLDYNLGLAHQAAGRATEAHEHFTRFVTSSRTLPNGGDSSLSQRREDAQARAGEIVSTHGAAVFMPFSGPGEAVVKLDGGPARVLGFTAYLRPGTHQAELVLPSGKVERRRIEVIAGQSLTVPPPVQAQPMPPPPPPPPPVPVPPVVVPSSGATTVPWPWLLGGAIATGASFGLPAGLWQLAVGRRNDALALGREHPDYAVARDDFEDARTGYRASYALPALLGAVTATIVIVEMTAATPIEAAAAKTSAAKTSAAEPIQPQAPTVGLEVGATGVWLRGSF